MPYATDYVGIIAIGLPFFVLSVGGNHIIRADRSPTYSMVCTLTGAIINTILDPLLFLDSSGESKVAPGLLSQARWYPLYWLSFIFQNSAKWN